MALAILFAHVRPVPAKQKMRRVRLIRDGVRGVSLRRTFTDHAAAVMALRRVSARFPAVLVQRDRAIGACWELCGGRGLRCILSTAANDASALLAEVPASTDGSVLVPADPVAYDVPPDRVRSEIPLDCIDAAHPIRRFLSLPDALGAMVDDEREFIVGPSDQHPVYYLVRTTKRPPSCVP